MSSKLRAKTPLLGFVEMVYVEKIEGGGGGESRLFDFFSLPFFQNPTIAIVTGLSVQRQYRFIT